MKAYIATKGRINGTYVADVITEQDYYERGPASRSYRALSSHSQDKAVHDCEYWCHKQGLSVVSPDCI